MRLLLRIVTISFFLLSPAVSFAVAELPLNTIRLNVDVERHAVRGVSEISLPPGATWEIDIDSLNVLSATLDAKPLTPEKGKKTLTVKTGASSGTLRVEYEALFDNVVETDREKNPGVVKGNLVDRSGIYLSSGWYPAVQGMSIYRLTAAVPSGFEAVSEADVISVAETRDRGKEFSFSFEHPVGGISLVAARYKVQKTTWGDVDIFAYFLPEDAGLADSYLEHSRKFIAMYHDLLGVYPFRRFSVVENVLPSGYSLPTLTLLGQDIVRLPFIVETSLGHEILHQWFGNLVYLSPEGGNWAEGLTTYLADQRYEELQGNGSNYRKQTLISFQSYVNKENDFPLASFSGRTDWASKAIGYGKGAMVFHMLRRLVGDELFFTSLRSLVQQYRFREASWDDIRNVFRSVTGKDVAWFFSQWLEEKGAPELEVKNILLQYRGAKAVVSFDIVQKGKSFRLRVPVLLRLRDGEARQTLEIEKEKTSLSMETDGVPVELVVDGDYDIFRRLAPPEFPPVVSRLIGDARRMFVIPSGKDEDFAAVSDFVRQEGYAAKKETDIAFDDMKGSSLVIGDGTGLAQRFFAGATVPAGDFSISVRDNPFGGQGVVALVNSSSPQELPAYLRRITHYGKYSLLSFEGGKNSLKSIAGSQQGIRSAISAEVTGVQIPRLVKLEEVIRAAREKNIIYIGEVHDRFEHHRVQYEVLRALHDEGRKVAIGMEMFQSPFQDVIDDYIGGRITEKEFLKKTEYFKRWGFDYNLYREILLYAREFGIPVIALNIKKEIVAKVAKEGLNALTREELAEIPPGMDLADGAYRERLRRFFEGHQGGEKNFDFFYEAQVLWDESMAHNLNRFIREHPDHQVVVMAGVGHLAFGSGIPKRAHRLNGSDYIVILNTDDVERQIADFVLFPETVRYNESPRLGVQFKDEGKRGISGFAPNSAAEKAGVQEGDVILSLNGVPVESVEDMKLILLDVKKGDEVKVKVRRRRFLLPDQEKEFTVKF